MSVDCRWLIARVLCLYPIRWRHSYLPALCYQQVSAGRPGWDVRESVPDDVRDLPVSSGADGHADIAVPDGVRHQRRVFRHDDMRLRL